MPRSVHVPQRQNQTSCLLLEKPPQEVRAQPLTSQNGVASRCGRAAMAENRTMKEKPALCIQGMAREFVRESIIEDAATRLIVQIMTEVADAHIAPRDAEIASLRAQLDEARRKAIEECMAVVIEMREGFLSPEYATGQPLSSMNERIACSMILNNLTALLSESKT